MPAPDPPPPPPPDRSAPSETRTALFAMGCFWAPDARFGALDGVVRTCVGYAGGSSSAPTYDGLGNHIETVRVAYDPDRLSYADLLDHFWAGHDPTRAPLKRQYQSALFPQAPDQEEYARTAAAERAGPEGNPLTTEIIADASFHRAEADHQKHMLRRHPPLLSAFQKRYSDAEAFADAPSAALVNGYVGGYRPPNRLDEDLSRLGLPDEAADALRTIVARRRE